MSLVEQVAGVGGEWSQCERRFRGAVERIEEEQTHGGRLVDGHRAKRGLGDDPQRAIGSAEQPRKVDEPVTVERADEILKLVAAVSGAGGRLGRGDQRSRRDQDVGHAGGELPEPVGHAGGRARIIASGWVGW